MAQLLSGTRIYGTGTVDTQLLVTGTTNATSTVTGALVVAGGVGIGKDLYVGGIVTATSFVGAFSGTVTGAATQMNTQRASSNAVYYPTFVDSNNASATAETIYTTSSFSINPSTGNISIGTTTSSSKLTILGNGGTNPALSLYATEVYSALPTNYIQFSHKYNSSGTYITGSSILVSKSNAVDGDTQTKFSVYTRVNGGSQTERFSIDGSTSTILGGLQVGNITWPAGTAAGEIRATNEITAYYSSDIRLKENIISIEDPIKMLEQIRGVYFDWTDEHIESRGGEDGYFVRKHDIGVIAQEVEAILPEIVATREDGFKAVKYEKMVPLLIETIKAQQKQIDQIMATLKTLINK